MSEHDRCGLKSPCGASCRKIVCVGLSHDCRSPECYVCSGGDPRKAPKVIIDEPPPRSEDKSKPAIWLLVLEDAQAEIWPCSPKEQVLADMQARHELGIKRYGTPLQPFNGRRAVVDAYQEALDLVAYSRQDIFERYGEISTLELESKAEYDVVVALYLFCLRKLPDLRNRIVEPIPEAVPQKVR